MQQFNIDFNQIFIVIVKSLVFYILLINKTFSNLDINHINIKTSFEYREIDLFIVVKTFKGYYNYIKDIVYKINKKLYDVK